MFNKLEIYYPQGIYNSESMKKFIEALTDFALENDEKILIFGFGKIAKLNPDKE